MKQAPRGFALDQLAGALLAHWAIRVDHLDYLPVGFGAHHWRASETSGAAYFLALHDLGVAADAEFESLTRALDTASWLQHQRELAFVLAPLRDQTGVVVRRYGPAQALAVYPWVACQPRLVLDAPEVGHMLTRLHGATKDLPTYVMRTEDFRIPSRAGLETALLELEQPWDAGPFGEPARARLREAAEPTRALLALYHRLAASAGASRSDWVTTHGEPYGPNLVETDDGRTLLVDWDSALLAPRERDLWEIPPDGAVLRAYVEMTRVSPGAASLRLYRAWYHLAETAIYVHQFRHAHTGDLNDTEAWEDFLFHLPSHANWPELE